MGREEWLKLHMGFAAEVKHSNQFVFWVKPSSGPEFQRMLHTNLNLSDALLLRLNRWTEVVGPNL